MQHSSHQHGPKQSGVGDSRASRTEDPYTQQSSTSHALPAALALALHELGEAATNRGITVALKGGVACFYHSYATLGREADSLSLRQVSLDVDWTCKADPQSLSPQLNLLRELSGSPVDFTQNTEEYGTITFSSQIARARWKDPSGIAVDLDLIPVCRFAPDLTGFTYEFGIQETSASTGDAVLPNRGLRLNARETILCEKLALGRGAEKGKFDTIDAALILASAPINLDAVLSNIEAQNASKFDLPLARKKREAAVVSVLRAAQIDIVNLDDVCEQLSDDGLKRLALTARFSATLAKIDSETLAPLITERTAPELRERMRESLKDQLHSLRAALSTYAHRTLD